MEIDSLQRLTPKFFIYLAIFVFSFLTPGFLFWYIHNPDLFIKLELSKLIVLSISITAPTFIAPYFITEGIHRLLREQYPEKIDAYGKEIDWYIRHGWNNALNMYLIVAIFYTFDAKGLTILLTILGAILINVLFEALLLVRFIKQPLDSSVAAILRSQNNA